MKGYTDFFSGFFGPEAVATKPINDKMKCMDWYKVERLIKENPTATVYAGLKEDWGYTSGLIYSKGKYYCGCVYGTSCWATPIVDIDGEEIECWTTDPPEDYTDGLPLWWGRGQKLLDELEFFEGDQIL